ncbi:hypothetical protein B0H14DRAFT_3511700 [Mycena olivaceomarginata]|nr:hypothetical protein B0H14DRAFT_3511700 [Mycena olivaceomarginata]
MSIARASTAPCWAVLLRGQDYDAMQHETLLVSNTSSTYSTLVQPGRPGHEYFEKPEEEGLQQAKKVQASMKAVSEHNINLHRAHAGLAASLQNFEKAERAAANPVLPQYLAEYQRLFVSARAAVIQAQDRYENQLLIGKSLSESGAPGVILPIPNN